MQQVQDLRVSFQRRRRSGPAVAALLAIFLCATLLVSVLLERVVSPFGDALIASSQQHTSQVAQKTGNSVQLAHAPRVK